MKRQHSGQGTVSLAAPTRVHGAAPISRSTQVRPALSPFNLAEILAEVGPDVGESLFRQHRGGLETFSWYRPHPEGNRGWWWVILRHDLVIALGWTSGNSLQRDVDLASALAGVS